MIEQAGPLVQFQFRSSCYRAVPAMDQPPENTPSPAGPIDLAEEFHEASKIRGATPAAMLGPAGEMFLAHNELAWQLGRKSLAHSGTGVSLPRPSCLPVDLVETTLARRSGIEPGRPITLAELGAVLGLSAASSTSHPRLRMCPSAGALYPLDLIVVVSQVIGLPAGAFVYDPLTHALLRRGDLRVEQLHECAAIAEPHPPTPVTIAVVATFARSRVKYGLRGYRFALLEAGHLVQAMITAATALGLRQLPWAGFVDAEVDRILDIDGVDRSCLYLLSVSGGPDAQVTA